MMVSFSSFLVYHSSSLPSLLQHSFDELNLKKTNILTILLFQLIDYLKSSSHLYNITLVCRFIFFLFVEDNVYKEHQSMAVGVCICVSLFCVIAWWMVPCCLIKSLFYFVFAHICPFFYLDFVSSPVNILTLISDLCHQAYLFFLYTSLKYHPFF